MMWNAMVPALAHGTRLIAYDGSPFHPNLETFLKFISDQGQAYLYRVYALS